MACFTADLGLHCSLHGLAWSKSTPSLACCVIGLVGNFLALNLSMLYYMPRIGMVYHNSTLGMVYCKATWHALFSLLHGLATFMLWHDMVQCRVGWAWFITDFDWHGLLCCRKWHGLLLSQHGQWAREVYISRAMCFIWPLFSCLQKYGPSIDSLDHVELCAIVDVYLEFCLLHQSQGIWLVLLILFSFLALV